MFERTTIPFVFVGGVERSGTTVCAKLLMQQMGYVALPEAHFKFELLELVWPASSEQIRTILEQSFRWRIWQEPLDLKKDSYADLGELMAELGTSFAASKHNLVPVGFIDHTPNNLVYASKLSRHFRSCEFVQVIRCERDVVRSLLKTDWGFYSIAMAQEFFRTRREDIAQSATKMGSVHIVNYESLPKDIRSVISKFSVPMAAEGGQSAAHKTMWVPPYTRSQHLRLSHGFSFDSPSVGAHYIDRLIENQYSTESEENLSKLVTWYSSIRLFFRGLTVRLSRRRRRRNLT